jgi:hypothetical protein
MQLILLEKQQKKASEKVEIKDQKGELPSTKDFFTFLKSNPTKL